MRNKEVSAGRVKSGGFQIWPTDWNHGECFQNTDAQLSPPETLISLVWGKISESEYPKSPSGDSNVQSPLRASS